MSTFRIWRQIINVVLVKGAIAFRILGTRAWEHPLILLLLLLPPLFWLHSSTPPAAINLKLGTSLYKHYWMAFTSPMVKIQTILHSISILIYNPLNSQKSAPKCNASVWCMPVNDIAISILHTGDLKSNESALYISIFACIISKMHVPVSLGSYGFIHQYFTAYTYL
jgi:hypothetical protein